MQDGESQGGSKKRRRGEFFLSTEKGEAQRSGEGWVTPVCRSDGGRERLELGLGLGLKLRLACAGDEDEGDDKIQITSIVPPRDHGNGDGHGMGWVGDACPDSGRRGRDYQWDGRSDFCFGLGTSTV